ncbi:helix-turn-helix domain-containing protein [Micromonospora deserti]|uniref:HTH cro/C1-type domain-containing protein n=1 Tax=Micromonospora deserti TaxID=2070366 RepID=A0A2W2CVZ4_9ACTN|nr:helix-turn-helix transcriptional regulator [Micromonospora deserti]PZG02091.1 hypothetical protein C1I99_04165 [Micromonospora deserti]
MVQASEPASTRGRWGRELRRWRARAGLTQLQLAVRLGYDHTYISKIESGHRLPRIEFASRADGLLDAGGSLIAAATSVLTDNRPGTVLSGAAFAPLRRMAEAAYLRELSTLLRRGRLPTLGVTCPLHDNNLCEADSPIATLAELLAGAVHTTIGVDAVHGLITLLRGFIDADRRRSTTDVIPVEHTLGVVIGLMPRARGRMAVGLMQVAARYADLAGWLRVEQGQYGIGMILLQRAVEWGQSSGNVATVCEALSRMSIVARLEGDGLTALAYAEAIAAVEPARRWTTVLAELDAARCYAHVGDQREFEAHISQAQRAAGRLGDHDLLEAPWLFGAEGNAFIASHVSGGLRDLTDVTGDGAIASRATRSAQASLASIPASMHPSRILLTLRVADTYACRGELEAALEVARPVVAEAISIKTALIRQELGRLRIRVGARLDEMC